MPGPEEKYKVKETPSNYIYNDDEGVNCAKKCDDFQTFLYNKEKGTFCSRTCSSWGKIAVFYVIFYGILAGAWYGQMRVFFLTLNDDSPNLKYLDGSIMMNAPGLGFAPVADLTAMKLETPELGFVYTDPSTYADYISQINTLLNTYNSLDTMYVSDSCGANTGVDSECNVNLSNLGACDGSDPNYGFDTGEPCIFFQINKYWRFPVERYHNPPGTTLPPPEVAPPKKIIGWEPEVSASNPEPSKVGGRWNSNSIPLYCVEKSTALDPTDNLGIGSPTYYPSAGIPLGCFPYCGPSVNFTQGIAAVKFTGLTKNRFVRVMCSAYVANVATSEKHKTGAAVFGFNVKSSA